MVSDNEIKYFLPGLKQENDKQVGAEITQYLQRNFKDVFNGKGCFDRTISLQVKADSKPYQYP